jgi:hypothetical protein
LYYGFYQAIILSTAAAFGCRSYLRDKFWIIIARNYTIIISYYLEKDINNYRGKCTFIQTGTARHKLKNGFNIGK